MSVSSTPLAAVTPASAGVIAFDFTHAKHSHTHSYLWPAISGLVGEVPAGTRVLDVGCGGGALAARFLERGCYVVGIDASESGIASARQRYPAGRWEVMLADEAVLSNLNEAAFDVVLSTEVVEHLYNPRAYMRGVWAALRPGGKAVISTPYHGYLKNLAISVRGKWDKHADPLWDGGHIKLWSRRTLGRLMTESGLTDLRFVGAGRLPYLWMSMVMSGIKK